MTVTQQRLHPQVGLGLRFAMIVLDSSARFRLPTFPRYCSLTSVSREGGFNAPATEPGENGHGAKPEMADTARRGAKTHLVAFLRKAILALLLMPLLVSS